MKRRMVFILFLLFGILLAACSNGNKNSSGKKTVNIYYVDTKTSGLASEKYELTNTDQKAEINELLEKLTKTPKNVVYKTAVQESTLPYSDSRRFSFDESGSLIVNFNESYYKLLGVEEVLCRAAIVKTLCQVKGVEYIQFSVNDQPLKDSDGNVVGPLTSEDFIDNPETSTSYKVKLYFANKKGDALIEYLTDINYTGKEAIEELVLQQLINGPTKMGMYGTIPEGTVLLDVSKADGICTVDFNEKFLEKLPNINENIAIYSVVNTLVELPGINKVRFTINGEAKKTYWEDVRFDEAFERKLGLIENSY